MFQDQFLILHTFEDYFGGHKPFSHFLQKRSIIKENERLPQVRFAGSRKNNNFSEAFAAEQQVCFTSL